MSYALGYFAPSVHTARMDLGPETGPADYEARHQFEKGLNAMLSQARQPRSPFDEPGNTPAQEQYQEAVQWLSLRNPSVASRLTNEAQRVGVMAERRAYRPFLFGRKGMTGLGQPTIMVPWLPPGYSLVDAARAGVPVSIGATDSKGTFWVALLAAGVVGFFVWSSQSKKTSSRMKLWTVYDKETGDEYQFRLPAETKQEALRQIATALGRGKSARGLRVVD